MRTRVKICGITRADDAMLAAQLGADALGLVFYQKSPRAVSAEQARDVIDALPPFVTVVGLFCDPTPQEVAAVLHRLPVDILQFHGQELPEECSCYGKPYIKAVSMRPGIDLAVEASTYADARGLLLDTFHPGKHGGTGEPFDWSIVPENIGVPIILAGGLTAENVWQAISAVRPFAVDVSSGVEVEKGIKDPEKMSAFLQGVNRV